MRWLKHMTCANRDEKMMRVMDKYGAAGYGMYWLVLEIIAEKLDESNDTFVEMSAQSWRKLTGISPQTLKNFLSFCQVLGLFAVENTEDLIKVGCPNLLKYRDEYQRKQSKKSGQAPDKLQPKNIERETEEERERERVNKLTSEKTKQRGYSREFIPPTLEEVHEETVMKGYTGLDYEKFWAYYDAVGWVKSNGAKITNWRSALLSWFRKEPEFRLSKAADKGSGGNGINPDDYKDLVIVENNYAH